MIDVIYEDNHLIAVNKPAGMLVQEDDGGDMPLEELVKEYIKEHYDKPGKVFCGVVHRIDRPVSGVVLLARTSKALERMNKMFMERQITKIYWAVVTEQPDAEEGELLHWIAKEPDKNLVKCYTSPRPDAKEARLSYRVIGRVGKDFLLEIDLYTGRPHQIRAQLSKMGWPIKGDLKYGSTSSYPTGEIMLHSRKMLFEHPVKKEPCMLVAEIPNSDDWRKFQQLAN